jgi:hypothetical protein
VRGNYQEIPKGDRMNRPTATATTTATGRQGRQGRQAGNTTAPHPPRHHRTSSIRPDTIGDRPTISTTPAPATAQRFTCTLYLRF